MNGKFAVVSGQFAVFSGFESLFAASALMATNIRWDSV